MLPIVGVLIRLVGTSLIAGVSVGVHSVSETHSDCYDRVKTIHDIQLEQREIRKERIELEEELRILIRLRQSMLDWTESLEDETQISASIYKELSDLRIRAAELSEKIGVQLDEFRTLRGAKRTQEQILRLSKTSE
jgi:hypothetical protein